MRTVATKLAIAIAAFIAPSAMAQVTCTAVAASQPTMRTDGIAEVPADIRVTCTGGTPTAAGQTIPQYTFLVTSPANAQFTLRLLNGAANPPTSEALAFLDEPGAASQFLCATANGVCPGLGNGTGTGYYGGSAQTTGAPNNRNVFQGLFLGGNTISFAFPFDPPGAGATRTIRLGNFRLNLTGLGVQAGTSANVTLNVSATGPGNVVLPIAGSAVIVGSATPGLEATLMDGANNGQISGIAPSTTSSGNQVRVATLRFAERFASAFKRRNTALPFSQNNAPLPQNQDVLGFNYGTETAFYKSSFPNIPGRGNLGLAGLPTQGTRLYAKFTSIPVGAQIFVRSNPPLPGLLINAVARLISTNDDGSGTFSARGAQGALVELPAFSGEAVAVWEIMNSDNAALETIDIEVHASWPVGLNWATATQVALSLGPITSVYTASAADPMPRFAPPQSSSGGGSTCSFVLVPPPTLPLEGGNADISVSTQPTCDWTAQPTGGWLNIVSYTPANHIGNGVVRLRAPFNYGGPRSNVINIGTASTTINQAGGQLGIGTPDIVAPVPSEIIGVPSISLKWSAVTGATGYDARVRVAATGGLLFQGSFTGQNATFTVVDLPQGELEFIVRACIAGFSDANCGGFGTRFFTVNLPTPPANPTITAPGAGGTFSASTTEFRWQPVTSATSYLVQLIDLATGQFTYQISALAPITSTVLTSRSGSYELRVSSCTILCNTSTDNAIRFQLAIPPNPNVAPVISQATVTGGNSLTVTWGAVAEADVYRVFAIQPNTGPGGGALTVAAKQVSTTTATTPVPSGQAGVLVAACNGNGCGPFSQPASINAAGPRPAAPLLATPTPGTDADGPGVIFTWSRIPGDNGSNTTYQLYVGDLSRNAPALNVVTPNNFYGANLNSEGRRYDALVIANPGPNQIVGPAVGFTVRGTAPATPIITVPAHQSIVPTGNIRFQWTPVQFAVLYQYYFVPVLQPTVITTGLTPALSATLPVPAIGGVLTNYSAIVRACLDTINFCRLNSDVGWSGWSLAANFGVSP